MNDKQPIGPVQPANNPATQSPYTAMARKSAVIISILLVIAGIIYLIKTKPTIAKYSGLAVLVLFIFAYFFVSFWGPSRYQQWKTSNSSGPKTYSGPQQVIAPK